MLSRPQARSRRHGQRGAAAIMVALSMTALCLVGAMVLDFGLVRFDKQANQAAADLSATAGIHAIAADDGYPKPFRGVCQAINYLKANQPEVGADLTGTWRDGNGTVLSDPCSSSLYLDTSCDPDVLASWARFRGTADGGDITVEIESPYLLTDPRFADEEAHLSGDDGDPSQDGCDQVGVIVSEKETPGLGRLAMPEGDLVSHIRSVARVTTDHSRNAAIALLLLERRECLALSVEGTSPSIRVQGNGPRPGLIHSDSLGDGLTCSSTNRVIDAGGSATTAPRIVAEDAVTGSPIMPGTIGVVALTDTIGAVSANASDSWPTMVYAQGQTESSPAEGPTGRGLVGRHPVDNRYQEHVEAAIATARSAWTTPSGTVVNSCSNPRPADPATAFVFVNCPSGATYDSSSLPAFTGQTWVFNGPVTVSGQANLRFANASAVYIKGSTSGAGLTVKTKYRQNDGGAIDCASSTSPTPRSKLVIGSGNLVAESSGSLRMCQTSVILADTGAGDCPIGGQMDDVPRDNSCRGGVRAAGSSSVEWTAPDAVGAGADDDDWVQLEDLALWTESSHFRDSTQVQPIALEGTGTLKLAGVFFLPNANPFRVAGQGGLTIGFNAQFVARRVVVGGNGELLLRPDPYDVVTIPYFADVSLVR